MTFNLNDYCILWNNQTIYPDKLFSKKPESSCHLRAAIYETEAYTSTTSSQTFICSTHNEIFTLILKYLRCSLDIIISSENYGGSFRNGTWNGILGLFHRNESDFIPHIFTTSNGREELIEFNFLIPQKELLTIFSYPRNILSGKPTNFFAVFTLQIWALILLFFILYGLVNWINSLFENNSRKNCQSLTDNFFEMYALLIGQGTVKLPSFTRHFLRNPLILWILFSFLMRQYFSNDMLAMSVTRNDVKLDRFEQLFTLNPPFKLLLVNKSTTHYYFKRKYPSLKKQMVKISFNEPTSMETLMKVRNQNYLMILPRGVAETIQEYYSHLGFHISQEGFISAFGNYGIRKNLETKKKKILNDLFKSIYYFGLDEKVDKTIELNNVQLALRSSRESGIFKYLSITRKQGSHSGKSPNPTTSRIKTSTTSVILTYVFIYSHGMYLAALTFFIEFLYKRILNYRKLSNLN